MIRRVFHNYWRSSAVRAAKESTRSLEPLHKVAPKAAGKGPALHELLALSDALRNGRARERQLAEKELGARLRTLLRG